MSVFPVKHEKFPLSYIQNAKNFSVVKPLNSGEAVASPASPVPPPLVITKILFVNVMVNKKMSVDEPNALRCASK